MHSIYDFDTHFTIDVITRRFIPETSTKSTIMQYDHNSERITFEVPRLIEGHDVMGCNKVEIHYINVDNKTMETVRGVYEVDDLTISEDDENIAVFSWLVSSNATMLVGSLNFLVRFSCYEDGVTTYAWSTDVYKRYSITSGINNSNDIAYEYADILERWRMELNNAHGEAGIVVSETEPIAYENGVHPVWLNPKGDELSDIKVEVELNATNTNLLDNWYFLNPVNQREFTTGAGYSSTESHTIDRWRRTGYTTGVLTLSEDGFTVDSTGTTSGSNRLRQLFENTLPQNTYTFSILVTELTGELTMSLGDKDANALVVNTFTTTGVHTLTYTGDKLNMVYWGATLGSSVKAVACKLEIGDKQTLAHQENGVWVLNEIPNYAEQLARCQRYLFIHKKEGVYALSMGVASGSTSVLFFMPLPVSMRTTPAITFSNLYAGTSSSDQIAITNLSSYGLVGNGLWLSATVSGATVDKTYFLRAVTGTLQLSAEL